ncbi:hypothetical protein QR680_001773 [Steinernema hermaphroditum]|uniref:Uncharacterized protein n=1 Tax=Steinernema hermaphroditum TaxID=289476 RepID=A0AA39GZT0_9BILA|nr:hypothetical protein QR680_001773 [Steinernema hermaphroditum]
MRCSSSHLYQLVDGCFAICGRVENRLFVDNFSDRRNRWTGGRVTSWACPSSALNSVTEHLCFLRLFDYSL